MAAAGLGHEGLEAVVEAEAGQGPAPVTQDGIEGAQEAGALGGLRQAGEGGLPGGQGEGRLPLPRCGPHCHGENASGLGGGQTPGPGRCQVDGVPEARQLPGGEDLEAVGRSGTGPFAVGFRVGAGQGVGLREHPLGQVVDLLETLPPGHQQLAAAPEEVQGGLLGFPAPPGAPAVRVLEVRGLQWSLLSDAVPHGGHHLCGVRAPEVVLPPGVPLEPAPVPLEPGLPVGIPRRGDGGGIVGETLEEVLAVLQQAAQVLGPVGVPAGGQGEVVGPGHHIDAVNLHEAQALNQGQEGRGRDPAGRVVQQALGAQEEAPGGGGRHLGQGGHAAPLRWAPGLKCAPPARLPGGWPAGHRVQRPAPHRR